MLKPILAKRIAEFVCSFEKSADPEVTIYKSSSYAVACEELGHLSNSEFDLEYARTRGGSLFLGSFPKVAIEVDKKGNPINGDVKTVGYTHVSISLRCLLYTLKTPPENIPNYFYEGFAKDFAQAFLNDALEKESLYPDSSQDTSTKISQAILQHFSGEPVHEEDYVDVHFLKFYQFASDKENDTDNYLPFSFRTMLKHLDSFCKKA